MITRIHVNQHVLKRNKISGKCNPAITVKQGASNTYAHEVEVKGPSRLVYSPDKPLSCGAVLWLETEAEVVCYVREVVAV